MEEQAGTPTSRGTGEQGKKNIKPPAERGPSKKTLQTYLEKLDRRLSTIENSMSKITESQPQPPLPAIALSATLQFPEMDDLLNWVYTLNPKKFPASEGLIRWLQVHRRPWMLPGALNLIRSYLKQKPGAEV